MKPENRKGDSAADRVQSRKKETAFEIRKEKLRKKCVPRKKQTQQKSTELRVVLERINPQNVDQIHWVQYLKEIEEREKKKAEELRETLKKAIMTDHVKRIEELVLDGNMSENWRRFKRNYNIFAAATKVNAEQDAVKIATFLNAIGPNAVDLFDSFVMTEENRLVYERVVEAFEGYCNPRKNVIYERYRFNQRNQRDGEKFDEFLLDLKLLARYCEFGGAENELLRDRIVAGVVDNRLTGRLLETTNLRGDERPERCHGQDSDGKSPSERRCDTN